MMKRTKIICTMGPATADKKVLRALIENGMDVARFNFSHGTHEEQKQRVDMVKELSAETGKPIALLLDTKGPEIRTGLLQGGKKAVLSAGQTFCLTTEEVEGNSERVHITYSGLPEDVGAGSRILLDDGLLELQVVSTSETEIICRVLNGGELGERKGVNVPNVKVRLPGITDKDKEDIIFGIQEGFDYIAASFVRSGEVIREIRNLLDCNGGQQVGIIAKIENAEGIENIDEIIRESDGIMVARGDMGVEVPAYQVPHIQKKIISKCNDRYVPVITATQMLDSMIRNPRPTRAEVTDVANAIYDGTDAIMLSGETAAGKYPVESLKMMAEIAENTEKYLEYEKFTEHRRMDHMEAVSSAVGYAAVLCVKKLHADAIVAPTVGGKTARLISSFRPKVPIYAVTPSDAVLHKLQLYWGITPLKGYEHSTTEHIIQDAFQAVKNMGMVKAGQLLVFTAGDPITNTSSEEGASTNMLQVVEVGAEETLLQRENSGECCQCGLESGDLHAG